MSFSTMTFQGKNLNPLPSDFRPGLNPWPFHFDPMVGVENENDMQIDDENSMWWYATNDWEDEIMKDETFEDMDVIDDSAMWWMATP